MTRIRVMILSIRLRIANLVSMLILYMMEVFLQGISFLYILKVLRNLVWCLMR